MNENIKESEYTFESPIYSVYARTDAKNRVTRIFSTCFEQPSLSDSFIKSGSGDEFVHVGYYQLYTESGELRYKIEDGKLVERTEYELADDKRPSEIDAQILKLKKNLTDTDYIAIKFAENWITEDEYTAIRMQRQAWRDEINELEIERTKWEV